MRDIVTVLMALFATGCVTSSPAPLPEVPLVELPVEPVVPPSVVDETLVLDIQSEGYQSLLAFVQKEGKQEGDNDIQYTYWDQLGNRHAIVAIYKPDDVPIQQASPIQISVWVNGRNAKPGKEYFSYIITDDGAVQYSCFCTDFDGVRVKPYYGDEVRVAVDEVLELAKIQN